MIEAGSFEHGTGFNSGVNRLNRIDQLTLRILDKLAVLPTNTPPARLEMLKSAAIRATELCGMIARESLEIGGLSAGACAEYVMRSKYGLGPPEYRLITHRATPSNLI